MHSQFSLYPIVVTLMSIEAGSMSVAEPDGVSGSIDEDDTSLKSLFFRGFKIYSTHFREDSDEVVDNSSSTKGINLLGLCF